VEKQHSDEITRITNHLEKMKRHMLTFYLEVGKDLDETVSKLTKQINKLDIEIEDLNLDTLKYRILSSIVDEAGITELLIRMDEWKEASNQMNISKLSKVMYLLDIQNCKDFKQYMNRLDEAVQELNSA
jgi:ERCC4-related helicase